jgi:hypothetical protein
LIAALPTTRTATSWSAAGTAIIAWAAVTTRPTAVAALLVCLATATAARGTGGFHRLHLIGRENLCQFGLGVLLKLLDLLLLIVSQVQLVHDKSRKQMEPCRRRSATTGTASLPAALATRAALAPAILRWRPAAGILCRSAHGDGRHGNNKERKDHDWKTPHDSLPKNGLPSTVSSIGTGNDVQGHEIHRYEPKCTVNIPLVRETATRVSKKTIAKF